MYPLPMYCDPKTLRHSPQTNRWKIFTWNLFVTVLIFGTGFPSCFYGIFKVSHRNNTTIAFRRIDTAIHLVTLLGNVVTWCFNFLLFRFREQLSLGRNQGIWQYSTLSYRYPAACRQVRLDTKKSMDMLGSIVNAYVFLLASNPVLFVMVLMFLELDPYYWIVNEFLPSPLYADLLHIVSGFLVRLVLCTLFILEFMRLCTFLTIFSITSFCHIITVLSVITKLQTPREYIREYRKICLSFYRNVREPLSMFFFAFAVLAQAVTTTLVWLTISSYKYLSFWAYMLFPPLAIYIIFVSAVLILGATKCDMKTETMIAKWRLSSLNNYRIVEEGTRDYRQFWRSRVEKNAVRKQVRSLLSLKTYCGGLFTFKRITPLHYFSILMSHVTTALLTYPI
ncbi:unnamed protein product [Orchesella dallaii]|uniref:Gustatory receptor n=1 Tax=Orchesella dallaii TaxID=48710 RepID=A0ABP1R2M4_9HEXA